MNVNLNNEVLKIISKFQNTNKQVESVHAILKDICNVYNFSRSAFIIEDKIKSPFITTFDYDLSSNTSNDYWENKDSNLDAYMNSVVKQSDDNIDTFKNLFENTNFLKHDDFNSIKSLLSEIGFTSTEPNIRSVYMGLIIEGNFFGYFIFTEIEDNQLTLEDMESLKILFTIIINSVRKYELHRQINHIDSLTNSPTIESLEKYFQEKIRQDLKNYALCTLDVDKFKYFNNIFGYKTGDEILQKIAYVLRDFIIDEEVFCRINEDKFALILSYDDIAELEGRLSELVNNFEAMRQMFFADKRIIVVGGITLIDKNKEINLLIDQANIARKTAKGSHENKFLFYDIGIDEKIEQERKVESKMLDAIKNNEFIPYFQAKFNLHTEKICGAEALVRWQTKDGMIFPDQFIPVFEKNGFIGILDFIVYEKVMQHIRKALDDNLTVYPISINVSRSHINDKNFIFKIMDLIYTYNIPLNLLELEVTESLFVEDKTQLQTFIDLIKEQNLKVSIDDFGTAYSSLHILKDVNVDVLKIDKEFLHNINCEDNSHLITKDEIVVKHIINMAKELGFDVICEGIETKEQVELLKKIGCSLGQGYYFARPIPEKDYIDTFYKKAD